jgi:hypothetical protein
VQHLDDTNINLAGCRCFGGSYFDAVNESNPPVTYSQTQFAAGAGETHNIPVACLHECAQRA